MPTYVRVLYLKNNLILAKYIKIIDLGNPLVTDEAKELVEEVYKESIDPTDRGYKNLMKMMMDDGLFKYLPKDDNAWVNFLKPFLKLTRKEKRKL